MGGGKTGYIGGFTVCGPDSSPESAEYYGDEYSDYPESSETAIERSSSLDLKSYNDHYQISDKVEYTGYGGGCSGKVTKTFKSGAFVDGRNGNPVYKKEVGYDYSLKVKDEKLGITTHYETQVKHKKTTSYANPSSRSGGGKSSSSKYISKGSGSGSGNCEIVAKNSSFGKSSGGGGSGSSPSRAYSSSKKTKYSPY